MKNKIVILIIFGFFLIITPCVATDITLSTVTKTNAIWSGFGQTWSVTRSGHDLQLPASYYSAAITECVGADNIWVLGRKGYTFNASSIPDGEVIISAYMTIASCTGYSSFSPNDYTFCKFTPSNPDSYVTGDWSNFFVSQHSGCWTYYSTGSHNITISDTSILTVTGSGSSKRLTVGCVPYADATNTNPGINSNYPSNEQSFTPTLHITTGPEYSVELSATGTFCYSHPITFNFSVSPDPGSPAYLISYFKNGNPTGSYLDMNDGTTPFIVNRTLEPGNWSVIGSDLYNEYEDSLNFVIESSCSPLTFNGTINSTFNPWNGTPFVWNITPEALGDLSVVIGNWTPPTFDHGNGTSLIDYMYSHNYITEDEYNTIYNQVQTIINNNNNASAMSMNYTYGVLTPLFMINDSVSTIRANVNSSYSFLANGISPITIIFTWIFQIFPDWLINIGSVILTLDGVRIVLNGRKN